MSSQRVCFDTSLARGEWGIVGGVPHSLQRSAWAIRAAPTRVGGFPLLAVLVYIADEHPAIYAGTRTLQASVVRLYGVVVILSRWVRVGCARLCGVHSEPPSSVGRAPGCYRTCGAIPLSDVLTISFLTVFVYSFNTVFMLN